MPNARHRPTHDWLITPAQLVQAMRLQAGGGGVIGPVSCRTPASVTNTAVDDLIPALEAALDRASGNRFTSFPTRRIHFKSVRRSTTHAEDVLDPSAPPEQSAAVIGLAVIEIEGRRSLPLDFTIDQQTDFAMLDDNAENIARRWIAQFGGPIDDEHPEHHDAVPEGFEDSVKKLLDGAG